MRQILSLILLCCLRGGTAAADGPVTFLNPGVKLGYTFGPGGGFTAGVEVSVTQIREDWSVIPGIVAGIYNTGGRTVYHMGLQATSWGTLGMELGPALVSEGGMTDEALKLEAFAGFGLIPHYSCVLRGKGKTDLHEIGAYLKLPIAIQGKFRLSMG